MMNSGAMHRIPLTLRALVLVPLLALGVDHARASLACGPQAESCLEAAGHGWLGVAGVLVLLALRRRAGASASRRLARAAARPASCACGCSAAAGVAAVCGGQALLAAALGDGAALGGGWLELLALLPRSPARVLALALRAAPAAVALVRALRPAAPRPRSAPRRRGILAPPPPAPAPAPRARARRAAGRRSRG